MTTAQYRTAALKAEAELCWLEAGHCWEQAIAHYPISSRSALAQPTSRR